jgi:hypothetical protein
VAFAWLFIEVLLPREREKVAEGRMRVSEVHAGRQDAGL